MKHKAFGIHLGETCSMIGYVDDFGVPITIENSEGNSTTPSCVLIEDDFNYIVGDVAFECSIVSPERISSLDLHQIGKDKISITVDGKDFSPEDIASLIILKMVRDAEIALETKVEDVVVTCPDYSDSENRAGIKNACETVGLNVLDIITNHTAAVFSLGQLENLNDQIVLIYHLGGTVFDVSVVRVKNRQIEIIAYGENGQLGGEDWNQVLIRYLKDVFCKVKPESKGITDINDLQDLYLKVEKVKRQLSYKNKTKVIICATGEKAAIDVERSTFEAITEPLLRKTLNKTMEVLKNAKEKDVKKIDQIFLAGGSCMMPQVFNILASNFPEIPIQFCEPGSVFMKGAAIQADIVQSEKYNNSSKVENILKVILDGFEYTENVWHILPNTSFYIKQQLGFDFNRLHIVFFPKNNLRGAFLEETIMVGEERWNTNAIMECEIKNTWIRFRLFFMQQGKEKIIEYKVKYN